MHLIVREDKSGRDAWKVVLNKKLHELSLISSWASIIGLGRVRDLIRQAEHEIREEVKRMEEQSTRDDG